jgi:hypothetical protein
VSLTRAATLGNSNDHTGDVTGQTSTSPSAELVELRLVLDHPGRSATAARRCRDSRGMARFLADLAVWGENAVDGPEECLVHLPHLGGKPGERWGWPGVRSVRRRSGMGQDPGPLSLPAPDKRSPTGVVRRAADTSVAFRKTTSPAVASWPRSTSRRPTSSAARRTRARGRSRCCARCPPAPGRPARPARAPARTDRDPPQSAPPAACGPAVSVVSSTARRAAARPPNPARHSVYHRLINCPGTSAWTATTAVAARWRIGGSASQNERTQSRSAGSCSRVLVSPMA